MKKLKHLVLNIVVGVVSWLLLVAGINKEISPFFMAFVFALFYIEEDIYKYVWGACISRVLYAFSLASVVISVNFFLVLLSFKILQKRMRKKYGMGVIFVFLLLGTCAEFIGAFGRVETFVLAIINKILEVSFLYAYMVFFRGVKRRGINTRFALDELLGLSLIIAPMALATSKIYVYGISLCQFVVPLEIMIVAYLYGGVEAIAIAIISGIGVSFKALDLSMIAIWSIYASGVVSVKSLGRLLMAITLVVLDLMISFYFGVTITSSIYGQLPLIIAGGIFCCVPKRTLQRVKFCIYDKYEQTCLNEIISQEEFRIKDRFKKVSGLFLDMHDIYKNMVIGKVDKTQIEDSAMHEIVNHNCRTCNRYKICHEGNGFGARALRDLIKKGVGKGHVSLIDVSTMFASSCGKTNQILFDLNAILENCLKYEQSVSMEDESKILMSNQLLGVSELLEEFSEKFSFGARANRAVENALVDSFLYNDIIVKECAIFNSDNGLCKAIIVVRNTKYKKSEFLRVASEFFSVKTRVCDIKYSKTAGWQVVTIEPDTKFIYGIGVAKTSKLDQSGDVFSAVRLDENRAMFAISDGKGCGDQAGKISQMTIQLIENFYKVGFLSEHIMDNVNKVMSYKSEENFSAVDVAVLDLDSGRLDLVKRGGTPTVIKRLNESQVVEGCELPIGVMEQSKTRVITHYLNVGDVIVLASDGVFDAFKFSDNFAGFINNLQALNMQEFSKNILNEAIRLNRGVILDDMTVLAVKLILNR